MIKDAKSKASRTTNEVVRETFSIKRCQSSIAFKEGESANGFSPWSRRCRRGFHRYCRRE